MPNLAIELPPGAYRNGTEYESLGRWNDCDMVRWYQGTLAPMGGSVVQYAFFGDGGYITANVGISRGMVSWRDDFQARWLAIGCQSKLYAYDGDTADDITPAALGPGRTDSVYQLGYGVALYGADEYGTPRASNGLVLDATTWALSLFGDTLLAVSNSDGGLYYWVPNASQTEADLVTTAPTMNVGVIVTNERHVVLYGAGGDPRKVQWASQETYTDWTPDATNTAGDLNIQTTGVVRTAAIVKGQTLIWTDLDVHLMTYLGPPFVYGIERVGSDCGAIAANAVVSADGFCAWMSDNNFFTYDGYVKPLSCDVWDYVFSDLNILQKAKVYAIHEPYFGEMTWYYPTADSLENDRFVRWNYRENHWAFGSIAYSAGVGRGVFPNPLLFQSADAKIMQAETGFDYGSVTPFVESGPIELGEGDQVLYAEQLIPDENLVGDVEASFKVRFYPTDTETSFGPYTLSPKTDIRFTGRQVKMRLTGATLDNWRVGRFRLKLKAGGER